MKALTKEINFLLAFALLIGLILLIGLAAIYQIHGLDRRIEDLGTHHLKLEGAVLGMRVKNANYAQEIRSYIFWHAARHQSARPMSEYVSKIQQTEKDFKNELDIYRQTARSAVQTNWGDEVASALEELLVLGNRIIAMVDKDGSERGSPLIQDSLMIFEKRIYQLDQFLNDPMGSSNLEAIQNQITLAKADKEHAISFLVVSLGVAVILALFIGIAAHQRSLRERSHRRDILNRMMDVEENERRKLSTAVHDEMGQDLSAMKIRLGLISQITAPATRTGDGGNGIEGVGEHLTVSRKIIDELIKKSHNIAFMLRPPDLDEVGLIESLEALLLESKHMTGISYDYKRPENYPVLSPEYSLLFYRITQELLTNMAKHAKARRVELALRRDESSFELVYSDDGQGFDYGELLKHPARRYEDRLRLGLIGLKERVELLDGRMRIDSSAGMGTRIRVTMPI